MYLSLNKEWLIDSKPINTRARDAPLFVVNLANTMSYERSVQHSGALEWNNLTVTMRNVDQYLSFKSQQLKWLYTTHQQ